MKVLIVDDEAPARARLRRLLSKIDNLEIVGEAADGLSALNEIEILKPGLIFLDIEMPELDGLSVAENIKGTGPAIIFITAYNEHALQAFEVSAIDYLVKPIAEERLQSAVAKFRDRRAPVLPDYRKLAEMLSQNAGARRLAVRCGARFVVLDPKQISAITAKDHYAAILTEGRELLADDSLDVLAQKLNPEQFIRVHRSAVINVDFLKELEREGDRKYIALLKDQFQSRVPVSRERLAELKSRLGID